METNRCMKTEFTSPTAKKNEVREVIEEVYTYEKKMNRGDPYVCHLPAPEKHLPYEENKQPFECYYPAPETKYKPVGKPQGVVCMPNPGHKKVSKEDTSMGSVPPRKGHLPLGEEQDRFECKFRPSPVTEGFKCEFGDPKMRNELE